MILHEYKYRPQYHFFSLLHSSSGCSPFPWERPPRSIRRPVMNEGCVPITRRCGCPHCARNFCVELKIILLLWEVHFPVMHLLLAIGCWSSKLGQCSPGLEMFLRISDSVWCFFCQGSAIRSSVIFGISSVFVVARTLCRGQ